MPGTRSPAAPVERHTVTLPEPPSPPACDTPTATAASLLQPLGDLTPEQALDFAPQRRRPGDFLGDLPVKAFIHPRAAPSAPPYSRRCDERLNSPCDPMSQCRIVPPLGGGAGWP